MSQVARLFPCRRLAVSLLFRIASLTFISRISILCSQNAEQQRELGYKTLVSKSVRQRQSRRPEVGPAAAAQERVCHTQCDSGRRLLRWLLNLLQVHFWHLRLLLHSFNHSSINPLYVHAKSASRQQQCDNWSFMGHLAFRIVVDRLRANLLSISSKLRLDLLHQGKLNC